MTAGSTTQLSRRTFMERTGATLALASFGANAAKAQNDPSGRTPITFSSKPRPSIQKKHLSIGCLIFPRQDQIDFTGPFEVFSRIPDVTVEVIGKTKDPVRDANPYPDTSIAEAASMDVLLVSGGLGQQALMNDQEILSLISNQAESGRIVFSVCTGALLCGSAGILRGRMATTHWAPWDLLHYYGAIPTRSRVVVDGNYISTAGVTAGMDGALVVASLLRGDPFAEEIQLDIEYAPQPIFHSGTPEPAPPDVVRAFFTNYGHVKESREAEAPSFAQKLQSRRERRAGERVKVKSTPLRSGQRHIAPVLNVLIEPDVRGRYHSALRIRRKRLPAR